MNYDSNDELGATKRKSSKKHKKQASEEKERKSKSTRSKKNYTLVDTIDESVKFLRRFKNMANKRIPASRILTFIKALQRAIHERRIRKGDKHAAQIEQAQRIAIAAYQKSSGVNAEMKVPGEFFEKISDVARSEKVRPSVAVLKRFVGMVGKPYGEIASSMKKLAGNLGFMYERGMIRESDPYFAKVQEAHRALEKAIRDRSRLTISSAALSGLNGIIADESVAGFL